MAWISNWFRRLSAKVQRKNLKVSPEEAYDLLASQYDDKKNRALNELDKVALSWMRSFLNPVTFALDFGGGTGRNIPFLLELGAKNIFAVDLSKEMLGVLSEKFPETQTEKYTPHQPLSIATSSMDLIICNLTLGYIQELDFVLEEWNRVLRPQGKIIVTDLHPDINPKGSSRTFGHKNKNLVVESRKLSFTELQLSFDKLNWKLVKFREWELSESAKALTMINEKSRATLKGKKMLFGYLLEKVD